MVGNQQNLYNNGCLFSSDELKTILIDSVILFVLAIILVVYMGFEKP